MTGFLARLPVEDGRPLVLCFHHAGGGASGFATWQERLGALAQVCPVQLPGREWRFGEPRFRSMSALVTALVDQLASHLGAPYVVYGHSMGSLVAYSFVQRLLALGHPPSRSLVVGAYPAPDLSPPMAVLLADADSSDEVLAERMVAVGGVPAALVSHPEWLSVLLPVIRDDLALCRSFRYAGEPPLPCPIRALAGSEDPLVSHDQVRGWARHTKERFEFDVVQGGHFFVREATDIMIDVLTTPERAWAG